MDPWSGYFGKIPARGDFVRAGLPLPFVTAWDKVLSAGLAAAKAALADRWPDVWLEAPVWRFALAALQCGPESVLGLWMPSIDRAGRHFPLVIAASCPGASVESMVRHGTGWLDAAEDAGRAAIADDLTPEQLTAMLPPPPDLATTADNGLLFDLPSGAEGGFWWTCGGPFVGAQGLFLDTMPESVIFTSMLLDRDIGP
jgi:type VI secretion system protein ImpM